MKSYLDYKTMFMGNNLHEGKSVGELDLVFKSRPKISYSSNFYKIPCVYSSMNEFIYEYCILQEINV